MIKHSCINHDARKTLGISATTYLVLDYLNQMSLAGRAGLITNADIARDLGISENALSAANKEIADKGLFEGSVSQLFFKAQLGEQVQVNTTTDEIVGLFNEMNGTRFSAVTYDKQVRQLLAHDPSLTIKHFRMVFDHKRQTWGSDEKMRAYNVPATILRKNNFFRYLDEARNFFMQKIKQG